MVGAMSMASAKTITTTYYGEKANDSIKNPCKGDLVRACAVIQTEIVDVDPIIPGDPPPVPGNGGTNITTTVFDADGNIISSYTESSLKNSEEVVSEYMVNIPENATMTLSEEEIF